MLTKIPDGATGLADAIWIDLLDPSADERAAVEAATKVRLPTRADLEDAGPFECIRVTAKKCAAECRSRVMHAQTAQVPRPSGPRRFT